MTLYEHHHEPLASRATFLARLGRSSLIAGTVIGGSLALGVVGYHLTGGLGWIDSILNASMILTGMGPVDRMSGAVAKLFASAYALFSGVVFLSSVGILLAPALHRFMHHFHLAGEKGKR